ncbi:hypothetical protein AVI53_03335 [Piscirickettsia salmonis]|nr:hypothetical protein PSLF89_06265 [Piscirickettsia salmonis LF-89 = ATCC VR-1361]ALY02973.1 hypothetical protein AWE47_09065 [Piscirickettsia salmonis]AMA42529.1 hypothetical protein AWJ11_09270 [Piscirickettsia salmonis]AOS34999.1 hypothetical protein AVM72_06410 [Piscirickettsia salmonis]APS59707.1 hypothetical protein AVI53_03335 [Piscirickettsia salmonis]
MSVRKAIIAFSSFKLKTVERGFLGPIGASDVEARFLDFATVLTFKLWRSANVLRLSCLDDKWS